MNFDLVASGAGALGLSEAAAIEELQKNSVRFARAGGASAGSINSAGLAFGLPNLSGLWADMLASGKLEDWKMPGPLRPLGILTRGFGMIKGEVIRSTLTAKIGNATMGESPIPLRIVTCKLGAGKLVVDSALEAHKRVRVVDAVMCSLAVPFVINAQRLIPDDGSLYSDGGIVDNVPCAMWDDDKATPTLVLRFAESQLAKAVTENDDVRAFAGAVFKLARAAAEDEVSAKSNTTTVKLAAVADALNFAPSSAVIARMKGAGILGARVWLSAPRAPVAA